MKVMPKAFGQQTNRLTKCPKIKCNSFPFYHNIDISCLMTTPLWHKVKLNYVTAWINRCPTISSIHLTTPT